MSCMRAEQFIARYHIACTIQEHDTEPDVIRVHLSWPDGGQGTTLDRHFLMPGADPTACVVVAIATLCNVMDHVPTLEAFLDIVPPLWRTVDTYQNLRGLRNQTWACMGEAMYTDLVNHVRRHPR